MFGFNVTIKFYDDTTATFHNVTELEYNYPQLTAERIVAIRSDIHNAGNTYSTWAVEQILVTPATEKSESF
jgi:hypothetical protein